MISARLLVESGVKPDAAMESVRAARPGAIETPRQEEWVRSGLSRSLRQWAVRAAGAMRNQALDQQQWLLDLFDVSQPVEVLERDSGEAPFNFNKSRMTYATCRDWLITREERLGLLWAHAKRLYADDDLIIRPSLRPSPGQAKGTKT
jgi:hypothetical protein